MACPKLVSLISTFFFTFGFMSIEKLKSKRLIFIGLALIGIATIVGSFFCVSPDLKALSSGVAASILFFFLFEGILIFQLKFKKKKISAFFGKAILSNQLYLAYPDFILSDDTKELILKANITSIYTKPGSSFDASATIDIPQIVASNDLQAMTYVVSFLGHVNKAAPIILVDNEVVKSPDISFISFGFTSSDCTHMYLQDCKSPFFKINYNDSDLESITIFDKGKELKYTYSSDSDVYYGLIIKYKPQPIDHPNRVWILCAGLGPNGTTGASWFLVNKWKKIHKIVDKSEFIAVIEVPHYSDLNSKLIKIVKK